MGFDLDKFGAPDEEAARRARLWRIRAKRRAALPERDPEHEPLPEEYDDDDI